MNETGVSKKLFITVICIQAVVSMSDDVENKWPYAIAVSVMFLIYKVSQTIIDLNKGATNGEKTEKQGE